MSEENMQEEAVFESVGQALHVSFLIMSQDAKQDCPLRKGLIRLLAGQAKLNRSQSDWLAQLIGEASGTVNFAGLSGDEVRAQCATVTQVVKDHLHGPERWAIQARFIPASMDGNRAYFPLDRVHAVKNLANHMAGKLDKVPMFARDLMVARVYSDHAAAQISFRDLADQFGGNHMTYAREDKPLRAELRLFERNAMRRLEALFVASGLVAAQPVAA